MSEPSTSGRARLRQGFRLLCWAAALASPLAAETPDPDLSLEAAQVVPPPLQLQGRANLDYARELEARLGSLRPEQRKDFFRQLRAQQRSLSRFIEEMVFNYEKAKSLRHAVEGEDQSLAASAGELQDAQRKLILQYKSMARAMEDLRRREDPVKLDSTDLQADLYAGFQFSTLYQDQGQNASFFSKSLPFVALDLRNTFLRPGQGEWLETFGTLSFQSASRETSDTVSVITSTGNFRGEMGLWWMRSLTESASWGMLGSTGLVGYTTHETAPDLSVANRDVFRSTFHFGFTLRQEAGAAHDSVAEIAYERDPLFLHPDRLVLRGKVVLTQFGSSGGKGDFFMEGWASKGRAGRDEAVLELGIRLNTLSFLRSLGGGGKL